VEIQPVDSVARLQVEISDDLKRRLKMKAAEQDVTMAEICEEAISQFLDAAEAARGGSNEQ
jgi:predicted transcriptional regulator